jgi:hypothetical protein
VTLTRLCLTALVLAGCVDFRMEFQTLPPRTEFERIEAGVTTRAEVLRWVGPPEEVRVPAAAEGMRRLDARRTRALEGHQVFGNERWTWAREVRRERIVGLLPVGPYLWKLQDSSSHEERWWIEFDESGIVRSVSHLDEIGP